MSDFHDYPSILPHLSVSPDTKLNTCGSFLRDWNFSFGDGGLAGKSNTCRLQVLQSPKSCHMARGPHRKKDAMEMERKRLQRTRKAAGSATLATKGLGPRPCAVQVPIKTDQGRAKAGGLQGAAWRTKATQLPAALRLRGLIKPH